ncbi:hypothetical protein J6590_087818 [Homalodisca vitripennis]|nr:hypothetical protein J6590_087818 [Homalodisca vitripennis]
MVIKSYNSPMLLAILMFLTVSLSAEKCPVSEVPLSDLEESVLQQSRLQVSADLLRTVAVQQSKQNVLLSPFTIHSALLLLFFAASGDTELLLRKLLHIPDTLINAAYFKGVWLNQFLETETKKERFYKCNEEFYEVDMMTTSGFFTLWLDQDSPVKILEIPFKGRTISMIIVMPNQKHHEEVLHEFLYTFNNEDFEDVLRVLSKKIPTTVLVRLPKMVVEKEYNLEQVLNHLGGDLLFGAVTNFQDLFVKNRCITVLKTVLHNAKVEVDEEGSVKKDIANKHRRKFIVNRPFAYFIYQKPSKRVLFSGIFYSP